MGPDFYRSVDEGILVVLTVAKTNPLLPGSWISWLFLGSRQGYVISFCSLILSKFVDALPVFLPFSFYIIKSIPSLRSGIETGLFVLKIKFWVVSLQKFNGFLIKYSIVKFPCWLLYCMYRRVEEGFWRIFS